MRRKEQGTEQIRNPLETLILRHEIISSCALVILMGGAIGAVTVILESMLH